MDKNIKKNPRIVNIDKPLGLYIMHERNMINERGFRKKATCD